MEKLPALPTEISGTYCLVAIEESRRKYIKMNFNILLEGWREVDVAVVAFLILVSRCPEVPDDVSMQNHFPVDGLLTATD